MITFANSLQNYCIKFIKNRIIIIAKKLKALLLSAGLGTRLRPLTFTTPKCLVEINGEPLLINWLKKLEEVRCDEVLINTHYLSSQVEKVIQKWEGGNMKITISYEKELLGTAGTLRKNLTLFKNSDTLFIHADNYTDLNLKEFLDSFYKKNEKCLLSMVTFLSKQPERCGVIKTDSNGVLKEYFEKVPNPPSNIANGAIFAFDEKFLEIFSAMSPSYLDFCGEIIPKLKGKIQTYFTNSLFIDIGTPSSLKLAQKLFK